MWILIMFKYCAYMGFGTLTVMFKEHMI